MKNDKALYKLKHYYYSYLLWWGLKFRLPEYMTGYDQSFGGPL